MRLTEALPILQSIRAQVDAAVGILQARDVPLLPPLQPTPPTQQHSNWNRLGNRDQNAVPILQAGQARGQEGPRQEFVVQVPLPWQNVRGQPRMHFEVVNNQLMVRLSRHRR